MEMKNLFQKIFVSIKNINYKMFWTLLFLWLVLILYTILRVFFLHNFIEKYSYSIAGQLSWASLIFEIVFDEAIILSIYFFIGEVAYDKNDLQIE